MTDKNKVMTYHVAKSDAKKRRSRKQHILDTKIVNPKKLHLETCWTTNTPVSVEHINKKRKVLVKSPKSYSKNFLVLSNATCKNHSMQEPVANENAQTLSLEAPVNVPSPGLATNNVITDSFIIANTTIHDCQCDVINLSENQSQHSEPANVKTFLDVLCSPVLKTKKVVKHLTLGKRSKNEAIYMEREDLTSQDHRNKKTAKDFFKSSKLSCKRKLELSVESDLSEEKHSKQNCSEIIASVQYSSEDRDLVSNTTLDAVFNTTDLFGMSQAPTVLKANLNIGKDNCEIEEISVLEATQSVSHPPSIEMKNAVTYQPPKSFLQLSLNTGAENTALIPAEGKEIITRPSSNEHVRVMKSKKCKLKSSSVNLYSLNDKSPIPHKKTADSGPVSVCHILETAEMIIDADFESELFHRKMVEKGREVSKKPSNSLNKILSFNNLKPSNSSELQPTKRQQLKGISDILLKPNMPIWNSENLSNKVDSASFFNENDHNSSYTFIGHKYNKSIYAIDSLNNKTIVSTNLDKYLPRNSYQSNKMSHKGSSKISKILKPEFLDNYSTEKTNLNETTDRNDNTVQDLEMVSEITDTQLYCVSDFADVILDSQWPLDNCNKSFKCGSSFNAGDKSSNLVFTNNALHKCDSLAFEEKDTRKITPLKEIPEAKQKGKVHEKQSTEEIQITKMDENMECLYVNRATALIQSNANTVSINTEILDGSRDLSLKSSPQRITNNYYDTISNDFVSQVSTSLDSLCTKSYQEVFVPIHCTSQLKEVYATYTCPNSAVLGKCRCKFGNVKNNDTAIPTIRSVNMNNERKNNEPCNGKLLNRKNTINALRITNDHEITIGQVDEFSSESYLNARIQFSRANMDAVSPAIMSLNLDKIKGAVELLGQYLKTKPLFKKINDKNVTPCINVIKPAVEEIEITREFILKGGKMFEDEVVDNVASSFKKEVNIARVKLFYDSFESLLKMKVYLEDGNENVIPVVEEFRIACGKELAETRTTSLNAKQMLRDERFETVNSLIEELLKESEKKDNMSRKLLLQTKHGFEDKNSGLSPLVIGFVTASGNGVEVTKESLLKARQAFSEKNFANGKSVLENFETGSGENADVSNDSCFITVPLFTKEVVQNKIETTREKNGEMFNELKLKGRKSYDKGNVGNVTSLATGFVTASGKRVEVCKEALFKARQAFSEEDVGNLIPVMKSFVTCSGEKVDASKDPCLKIEPILAEEMAHKTTTVTNQFETAMYKARQLPKEKKLASIMNGFVTANGNRVEVSKKSLLKTKEVFLAEDFGKLSPAMKKIESVNGEKRDLSKNVCSRPYSAEQVVGNVISLIEGSETMNGKEFEVSRNDLPNTLEDIGSTKTSATYIEKDMASCLHEKQDFGQEHVKIFTPVMKGIETASGNKLEVSRKPLLKARQLLFEEENIENMMPEINGCETANGKSIEVSRKSLLKARQVFEGEEIVHLTPGLTSLKDNVWGMVDVSDSCLKIRHEFSENNVANTTPKIKGFETASGKKIELSRKSLLIAREVFRDGNRTPDINSLKPDSEEKVDVSNNIYLNEKLKFAEDFSNHTPLAKGFETAGGKKVEVSKKSLLKARELFEGENIGNVISKMKGFETANGKNMAVSKEAFLKANKVFGGNENSTPVINYSITGSGNEMDTSCDCCLLERKHFVKENLQLVNPFLNGFETASGKKVEVKRKSLLKARQVLGEDEIVTAAPIMNDTEIYSDKKVGVFVESDVNGKKIFGEDLGNVTSNMYGYNNQSGGTEVVTTESLLKAREVFQNNDFENETPAVRVFETASRKKVKVSKESLLKANQVFAEDGNTTLKSVTPVLIGFKTDDANKEKVTDELFSKTRQVFGKDGMIDLTKHCKFACMQKFESVEPVLKTKKVFKKESIVVDASEFENKSEKCCMLIKCPVTNDMENGNFTSYNNPVRNLTENEESLQLERPLSPVLSGVKNKEINRRMKPRTENYLHCKKNISNLPIMGLNHAELKHNYAFSKNTINKSCMGQENFLEGVTKLPNQSQLSPIINEAGLGNTKIEGACSDHVDKDLWFEKEIQNISLSTVHEVSESTAAFLADEVESFEVPDWAVAYHSSPSFLIDQPLAHSPQFCSDEWEKMEKQKPLSPILGSGDRFRKKLNVKRSLNKHVASSKSPKHCTEQIKKSAASSTPISTFKTPFKTSTPGQTPTDHRDRTKRRISSQLDFSAPFKQKHMLSSEIQASKTNASPQLSKEVVIEGRKKALEAQEIAIKNSNSLERKHFCVGSHLFHRLTDKTISLREAVKDKCPILLSRKQLMALGVKKSIVCVTSHNAVDFRFHAKDFYSDEICEWNMDGICVGDGARLVLDSTSTAGVEEVTCCFLSSPGIDPALVSAAWVRNHYKWIVWKMASTERTFPVLFANRYLTPNNMLLQLRYRYDREVDQCQRPALRKVLETDESAARRMVLVVSAIKIEKCCGDGGLSEKLEIELSDGWYSVLATVDKELIRLIQAGRVAVGTKLLIHGAELQNCANGCDPLQVGSEVRLKVITNSCRRARWDARLGFCSVQSDLPVALGSVLPFGGQVGRTRAILVRLYPLLYMTKELGGKTVWRAGKAEEQEAERFERTRLERVENVYSEVRAELEADAKRSIRVKQTTPTRKELAAICKPEILYNLLQYAPEPASIQTLLTDEQMKLVSNFKREADDRMCQELEERVRTKLEDLPQRHVTPMLKVRLIEPGAVQSSKASVILTVWRPSEEVITLLQEGNTIDFHNITACGLRQGVVQCSGSRQTRYNVVGHRCVGGGMWWARAAVSLVDFSKQQPPFCETDVVGVVVFLSEQTVYLADQARNFLAITLNMSSKDSGYKDTLFIGSFVAASDLQWHGRGISWNVPAALAAETSSFTQNPRQKHMKAALEYLKDSLKDCDLQEFISGCEKLLSSKLHYRETGLLPVSSVKENRLLVVKSPKSPLQTAPFTESRIQTDHTEQQQTERARDKTVMGTVRLPQRSPLQKKLRYLERYEDPPMLSPLSMPTPSSRLRSAFKLPTSPPKADQHSHSSNYT